MRLIKIDLARMLEQYDSLKSCSSTIAAQMESVQQVTMRLETIGLEEFGPTLQKLLHGLETENADLRRLMSAADTACQYYSACENRVLDNCEGANQTFSYTTMDFSSLGVYKETLNFYSNLKGGMNDGKYV